MKVNLSTTVWLFHKPSHLLLNIDFHSCDMLNLSCINGECIKKYKLLEGIHNSAQQTAVTVDTDRRLACFSPNMFWVQVKSNNFGKTVMFRDTDSVMMSAMKRLYEENEVKKMLSYFTWDKMASYYYLDLVIFLILSSLIVA